MPPATSPPLFPDVEVLLLHFLDAQIPAQAALTGARFVTDLPFIEPGAQGLWVRVNRVSGETHSRFTDVPVVDVDVYSFDRDASWLAARTVQNLLLWQLRGLTTDDGTVQNVTDIIGPRWLPDINQDISRVGLTVEIYIRVLPARAS